MKNYILHNINQLSTDDLGNKCFFGSCIPICKAADKLSFETCVKQQLHVTSLESLNIETASLRHKNVFSLIYNTLHKFKILHLSYILGSKVMISSWTGFNHGQILIQTVTHSLLMDHTLIEDSHLRLIRVPALCVMQHISSELFHLLPSGYACKQFRNQKENTLLKCQ